MSKETPTTSVPGWSKLPQDIREIILNFLADEQHGKANFASVCKEWQEVVEKKNFHQLKLSQHHLKALATLSPPRRARVRHIWLNIEFQPYNCSNCESSEPWKYQQQNRFLVQNWIPYLLYILSKWEPSEHGLKLELGMCTPNMHDHWLKNWFCGVSGEGERLPIISRDCAHNWGNIPDMRRLHIMTRAHELMLFNLPLRIRPIQAVTELPKLESLHVEPWSFKNYDKLWEGDTYYLHSCWGILQDHPSSLRSLIIFEEINEDIVSLKDRIWTQTQSIKRMYAEDPRRLQSVQLAGNSRRLEQMSVSFVAGAQFFFSACQSNWKWDRLESLILTSKLFHATADPNEISSLLQRVAQIVPQMPKLQTLVLWNSGRYHASAFTYSKKGLTATISWCSTWGFEFDAETMQAWEQVVGEGNLWIESARLESGKVLSHGHAIRLLELPSQVIDPVSRWQIEKEYEVNRITQDPAIHRTPMIAGRLN
ncbi:Oxoglutarate iron-dependent oxygenase protein [Fusarium austroafricanum]|uniref:Oxoglutarate iron-dependent oxygenase protein n=1 Tax=Fusarium austroafricanum TaxID=2364996 RepID=A0A8H4KDL1_9HYPO|nr:Oxoglutarate iron-dependent oxygenase protein [Fusarium austroafricanum]